MALGIGANVAAQKRINPEQLNSEQLNLYNQKAIKLRNTGRILTIAGIPVMAAGVLIANGTKDKPPDTDQKVNGISLALAGAISTYSGIPLWIIGGARKSKAEIALKKFNTGTGYPMPVGLGLTLRF